MADPYTLQYAPPTGIDPATLADVADYNARMAALREWVRLQNEGRIRARLGWRGAREKVAAMQTQQQMTGGYFMPNGTQGIGGTATLQVSPTLKRYLPLIIIAGLIFFVILKK